MSRPRVVVIGAGFGGLECARRLAGAPVDVVLIDRNNYHLFTPLLYQVASSLLNPGDIAYPVRAVFRGAPNVRFRMAEVTGIDLRGRTVGIGDDERLPWDWLVLATGTVTRFFGNREIASLSLGLKDLPAAMGLRNHILRCFEAAAAEEDPRERQRWLTFVVVGGGPTGVEYAGALSELARLVLAREYPELDLRRTMRIVLVEAGPGLLRALGDAADRQARRELERRGVELRLGVAVESATLTTVRLAGGETLETRTLIWAAGVKASAPSDGELRWTKAGRVEVDEHLRARGQERVFVVGDLASVRQDGEEIPMLAPPAMQEGRWAARQIRRAVAGKPLQPFRYHDRGMMATIGRNAAVARVGKLSLGGFPGWVAWLTLHLFFLIGFRNRLAVLLEWAWDYFRYDRPVRLITRAEERDEGMIGRRT